MSLSRHSSSFALTSSKRGSEKDSERLPEKSSIGEISSRISSRPLGVGWVWRARQAVPPTSQSKESVCRARRFGTSSGSRSFAKETRGAPGVDLDMLVTAKMRPSKDKRCVDTSSPSRSPCDWGYCMLPAVDRVDGGVADCLWPARDVSTQVSGLPRGWARGPENLGSTKRAAQTCSLAPEGKSVQTYPPSRTAASEERGRIRTKPSSRRTVESEGRGPAYDRRR